MGAAREAAAAERKAEKPSHTDIEEAPLRVSIRETILDSDDRGFYARLVDVEGMIGSQSGSNVHLVSLEPGAVRGNHYHELQTEHVWIIGGRVRFVAVDTETEERMDTVLEGAEAPLVTIPPGIAHAFMNVGGGTNHLLCLSRLESGEWYDDIVRNVVLEI